MPTKSDAITAPNPSHPGSRRLRRIRRIILWSSLAIALMLVAVVAAAHLWIVYSTQDRIYDDIRRIPTNQVGLIPGCDRDFRWLGFTTECPYFLHRVEAGAELYNRRKVRHLLPSGVGGLVPADQVCDMRDSLIQRGVPASAITMDGAGDRTLDSVVRAKEVFGLHRVTFITQRYHCYRTIYLARYYGLDAVAYCAQDEAPIVVTLKGTIREYLAQVKALLDLHILHTPLRHPLGAPQPLVLPPVPGQASPASEPSSPRVN